MKKTLKRVMIGLLAAVVLLAAGLGWMFRKEIQTLNSIQKVDDYGMYQIEYSADYGLDQLVASGGASSDSELVSYVAGNLLKGLPLKFNIPDFGCSTFQAQNEEGDWLFGRNYDLNYVPSMIVKSNPDHGYASIAVANISVLGYNEEKQPDSFLSSIMSLAAPYVMMDGLNEMGFSIGVLLIRGMEPTNQETDKLDLTTTSAMRWLLDKAATVEEAVGMLENMDMHASANASYNFQMADAQGDSAVIEYVDNQLRVIRKEDGEFQMLTNFLISEDVYGFGKGQDRYTILADTLQENNGILSEKNAMSLLEAVSQNKVNEETGTLTATQWSVVYNNTQKTAKIVAGGQFGHVIEVSLGQ